MSQEKLFHDLRAPLARAKTVAKLLREEYPDEQDYLPILLKSLEELDEQIKQLQLQWNKN